MKTWLRLFVARGRRHRVFSVDPGVESPLYSAVNWRGGTGPSTDLRPMNQSVSLSLHPILAGTPICRLVLMFLMLVLFPGPSDSEEQPRLENEAFFTLDNSINLREFADRQTGKLLVLRKGKGEAFGAQQRRRYCSLKNGSKQIQWVLNDLETGEAISRSANADRLFFGASVSKLFVAAALLHKQKGTLNKSQLNGVIKMIVISDNRAWKELQSQAGEDGTNDSGREAVDEFVRRMGYSDTKGFLGWLRKRDGTRIHGNELNALELSKFLYDTYHGKYEGAEVLWKIMHASRTGRRKIDKYTPRYIYVGGKTGTYDGPNESPQTIKHSTIRARNHAAILKIKDRYYGLSILSNTGRNEDVAVLGGGLIREYLGIEKRIGETRDISAYQTPSVACPASDAE